MRHARVRPDWKRYYASLYDDAKLLVAILPELHQVNDDGYPFKNAHQKIKDLMRAENVPVLEFIDGLKDHGLKVGS